jgi:hypothetical protein
MLAMATVLTVAAVTRRMAASLLGFGFAGVRDRALTPCSVRSRTVAC